MVSRHPAADMFVGCGAAGDEVVGIAWRRSLAKRSASPRARRFFSAKIVVSETRADNLAWVRENTCDFGMLHSCEGKTFDKLQQLTLPMQRMNAQLIGAFASSASTPELSLSLILVGLLPLIGEGCGPPF